MQTTRARKSAAWIIPACYAAVALAAGLTFPRVEPLLFPGLVSPVSASNAAAIYAAIASGMLALTGIVFSLVLVMVQFSATAYSPRLVTWVVRDPVLSHALGVFTAIFLYAIAALAGVDRNGSGRVPMVSLWVVVVLLVWSVAMFIRLVQQIGGLQISHVLMFTGAEGRKAIERVYPPATSAVTATGADNPPTGARTRTLMHQGSPGSIQSVDAAALVTLARASGGVIEVVVAVGDAVVEPMPLLHVLGARQPLDESALRRGMDIGTERAFEDDPAYAIRLLVDIAIRALSPAINDPTTAVQALDQIEDLLIRLGGRDLERGVVRDSDGVVRLTRPCPAWDDFLRLALAEICACGATSVQIMRRLNALLADVARAVPDARRPALAYWESRVAATIARSFADGEERLEASMADRQGLGVPLGRWHGHS